MRMLSSPVNEETILPEAPADDAKQPDVVDEVESEEVDTDAEEIESIDNGEAEVKAEEVAEPSESSPEKDANQERYDKLTKARGQAERKTITAENERDYWKQQAQKTEPEPVEAGKSLADFEYDEGKYTEYLNNLAKAEATAETQRVLQRDNWDKAQADYSGREAVFAENIDDYHTATSSQTLRFSEDMAAATMTTEQGPALRYYLAKNPEVSAKLSQMKPFDMAIELGVIQATKLGKEKPPSVTNTPKPVPKIAATDSTSHTKIDDPKISDAQFRKLREKQIANR
jgi:chromosome segregation ATPase